MIPPTYEQDDNYSSPSLEPWDDDEWEDDDDDWYDEEDDDR